MLPLAVARTKITPEQHFITGLRGRENRFSAAQNTLELQKHHKRHFTNNYKSVLMVYGVMSPLHITLSHNYISLHNLTSGKEPEAVRALPVWKP